MKSRLHTKQHRTCFYLHPKHLLVVVLMILLKSNTFAQVSGTVFKDFNANGTKDAAATYNEVGIAGVTVSATKPDGTALTVTYTGGGTATNSTGAYAVTGGTLGQIRLQFTIPSYTYASKGANGGTTVMFPTTATQNLAVNAPDDYWDSSTNPNYTLPCYVNGTNTGTGSGDAAIVSTPYSSTGLNAAYTDYNNVQGTGPMPRVDATIGSVGTVWGEAYHKVQKHYYFATFLKRHCGIADGPGYVYNFDYSSATPTLAGKFNLQGVTPANGGSAIDLGTVNRTGVDNQLSTDKTLPSWDIDAFGKVATISFGDADIQENTNYLWLVNLYQKALIRVDVSSNPTSTPPAGGVNQYILSSLPGYPTSTTGTLRPWALKFAYGKGYLGVIDDASTSGLSTDLKAYVLEFDPNNIAAGFTQKLLISNLNYKRTEDPTWNTFKSWINTYSEGASGVTVNGDYRYRAQPVLSDIEFDENDNMYVSFFDRFGHQFGYWNYRPMSGNTTTVRPAVYGEILKACKTTTGWEIEGTGTCHTGTAEFIQDISGDNEKESSQGAVAQLKGKNQLLQVSIDPHPQGQVNSTYWTTQGVNTYNLANGQIANWYSVYQNAQAQLFGKANGLGDIELQVGAAPIEIGNRVWEDTDKDGVQDAGEPAISGVTVTLYASNGTTVIGTATTDANGNYYFSNATGTSTASAIYGLNLLQSTNYILQFPLTVSANSLTTKDLGGNDLVDSDAGTDGKISLTTGFWGENNHTFDVGYVACTPPTATAAATQPTCSGTNAPNNGGITITGGTGLRYQYSAGATFSSGSAIPASITAIPAGGVITSTLANTTGSYTVRIYDATDNTCFVDRVVNITAVVCNTCTTPNAGADVTICLPKTTLNLTDAPSGTQWVAGTGNPATAIINPTTGVITGLTVVGTYTFSLQTIADATCKDDMQVIVTSGENPIPLCNDGSTSYTLIAPANLTNVIWYNMVGVQVGTGNSLIVNANLAGLADGSEAYYYQGVDGSSSGCDIDLCCPVKFITQKCCPVPNCATITVIKN